MCNAHIAHNVHTQCSALADRLSNGFYPEAVRRIIFADWLSKEKQMKPSACNAMGVMVRTKRRGKGIGIGERYILTVHWDKIVYFFAYQGMLCMHTVQTHATLLDSRINMQHLTEKMSKSLACIFGFDMITSLILSSIACFLALILSWLDI